MWAVTGIHLGIDSGKDHRLGSIGASYSWTPGESNSQSAEGPRAAFPNVETNRGPNPGYHEAPGRKYMEATSGTGAKRR